MTKKDYQAIARALYAARDSVYTDQLVALDIAANNIANVLQADNPRFSRDRFEEACKTGKCKGMPR